jgi:hypothetical protein
MKNENLKGVHKSDVATYIIAQRVGAVRMILKKATLYLIPAFDETYRAHFN